MRDKVAREELEKLAGVKADLKFLKADFWKLYHEVNAIKQHLGIKIVDVPGYKKVEKV